MKTLQIALVNKAKTPLGVDLSAMAKALQTQVSRDFAPIWQVDCNLLLLDDATDDYCQIYLFDDAQQAGALGEHHVTSKGNPIGNVYVKVTIQEGEQVSTVVSHELLELLADPMIDQVASNPRNGYIYAVETADAVETESYTIDGVAMSNFVTPAWFDPKASAASKFDFMGNVHSPFYIDKGGYANVQVQGVWKQIFGSQAAFERYHKKDHDRTPVILKQTVTPMASMKLFDPSKFPAVKAF